jgi:DNA-binding Lrp family transcriptional regulator
MASLSENERSVLRYLSSNPGDDTDDIAKNTNLGQMAVRHCIERLSELGYIKKNRGLKELAEESLREIDSNFLAVNGGYAEHLVLIASILAKPDESLIADELGYDLDFVKTVGSRLRTAGIWSGETINPAHRDEYLLPERGGAAFFLDGAVACGNMIVVSREGGSAQYRLTDQGISAATRIIKRASP